MNNSTYKLIVTVLVLVIVIGGSVLLYRNLQDSVDLGTAIPSHPVSEDAAPGFTVTDAEGNEVKLSDFRGKGVVLNFWASWCGPCKSEMPYFQKAYEQYGEMVHFMIVNMTDGMQETKESAKAYVDKQGFTFPVYYDTDMDAAMTYGASTIPATFFVAADGSLVARVRGAIRLSTLEKGLSMIME